MCESTTLEFISKSSGSFEIWSDSVSLLHIKGHREGENTEVKADNLTEVPKAQRATEP